MNLGLAKCNWRNALGALAIGITTTVATPAWGTPKSDGNDVLFAQVGVYSNVNVNSPTPLNLQPRVHIGLPEKNYSHHRTYRKHHRNYRRYPQYNPHYRRRHRSPHSHHSRHHRNPRGAKVIIITPGSSRRHGGYGSYGSYGSYGNHHRNYRHHRKRGSYIQIGF